MTELYTFLFCLGLGLVARVLYVLTSLLAERTNLLPVTVVLDISVCLAVGGAFTAYVVLTGAVIAPYMFAAVLAGYLFMYYLTRKNPDMKNDTHLSKNRRSRKKRCENAEKTA